eukprot:2900028-Prymnesium_polylepis.1
MAPWPPPSLPPPSSSSDKDDILLVIMMAAVAVFLIGTLIWLDLKRRLFCSGGKDDESAPVQERSRGSSMEVAKTTASDWGFWSAPVGQRAVALEIPPHTPPPVPPAPQQHESREQDDDDA